MRAFYGCARVLQESERALEDAGGLVYGAQELLGRHSPQAVGREAPRSPLLHLRKGVGHHPHHPQRQGEGVRCGFAIGIFHLRIVRKHYRRRDMLQIARTNCGGLLLAQLPLDVGIGPQDRRCNKVELDGLPEPIGGVVPGGREADCEGVAEESGKGDAAMMCMDR